MIFMFTGKKRILFARMEKINHLSLQTIQNIHTIANTYPRVLDFSGFCTNVHDTNDCKESGCGFKKFSNILSLYLKTSEQKGCFYC